MPRFVFLHQVKTGGKTVEKFLLRKFGSNYVKTTQLFLDETSNNIFDVLKSTDKQKIAALNNAKVISGHFPYGLHNLLDGPARYFTLLRDPVNRIRSYYAYSLDNVGSPIQKFLVEERISFDDFVQLDTEQIKRSGIHELSYVLDNGQSKMIFGNEEEFDRLAESDIYLSIDRIIDKHFDFVGVTECFDESFMEISKLLGYSRFNFYLTFNRSRLHIEASDFARSFIKERNKIDIHYHAKYKEKTLALRSSLTNRLALLYTRVGTSMANKYMALNSKE